MEKYSTCCFTGHRPQKLPWKFDECDKRYIQMKSRTKEEILNAIKNGYTHFISGMALGFDIMCAELIIDIKKTNKKIKLICAIPCRNQEIRWDDFAKLRYENALAKADHVECISNVYTFNCMMKRNMYMINQSSLVIALFNGSPGGTFKTIEYAKSNNLNIQIVDVE